jgi:nitroreductase
MEFLELVNKRRSVRSYDSRPVDRGLLLKCIEAARHAPSACNAQPWKFIIVDDKGLISEIAEKTCSGVYSINKFIKDAATLIAVCSDKEDFIRKVGKYAKGTDYYLVDIGIACEHLILQAEELGIGSCWIGWFDEKMLKKILNVPKEKRIDVIISLGYIKPSEGIPSPRPRKELSEIVSYNKY